MANESARGMPNGTGAPAIQARVRTRLDRQAVLQAARALVDRVGPDGLTLAALARALGIQVPSLYNHISGLPGLQRDLALLATRELAAAVTGSIIGLSGDDAVLAFAFAYRQFVLTYPGLYGLMLRTDYSSITSDPELADESARLVGIVVAVLAAYGLRGDDALHAVRGIRAAIHGFATLEAAGNFALALDHDESFRRLMRVQIEGLRQLAAQGPASG
jgi:AcrR family transcriptional regulator